MKSSVIAVLADFQYLSGEVLKLRNTLGDAFLAVFIEVDGLVGQGLQIR
jgi:hypothetical protein